MEDEDGVQGENGVGRGGRYFRDVRGSLEWAIRVGERAGIASWLVVMGRRRSSLPFQHHTQLYEWLSKNFYNNYHYAKPLSLLK